jgi:pilus assembly protein CpaB
LINVEKIIDISIKFLLAKDRSTMKRSQPFILLGLALCMALVTSVLVYNRLSEQPKVVKILDKVLDRPGEMVAVAASDLPWGTKLTAELIKLVPFPTGSLPQGHFLSVEALQGRVLLANLMANEPILESKLAPVSVTTGGLAAVTNPEKRAMAVKVDDVVGVAGFINPGNRVDVLVTLNHDPPITKVVLQYMLVLATGIELERKGKEDKPSPVKVITLEVTPEEGEKLALAATEGKLVMALRNQLSADPVLTKGATIPSLLSSYRIREEVKRNEPKAVANGNPKPAAPEISVELIQGGKVSTVTFKKE